MRFLPLLLSILLTLLSSSGCFYLVPVGKGGVAERFPIGNKALGLSQRLLHCEVSLTEQLLQGKPELYPALYRETQRQLTESRRLFKAGYYPQAELTLEPVEMVLFLMRQDLYPRAVSRLCNGERVAKEVCI